MSPKPDPQQPPPIESILPDVAGRTDIGYDKGLHLVGLRGTWHRLWAMMVLQEQMGGAEDGITEVRSQLEQILGRALSEEELQQLANHAQASAHRLT